MSLFEPRVTQTLMVIPVIHHFPLQIAMLRHHPTLAFAIFGCFNHVLSPHFRSFRSACVPFVLEKPAICWGPCNPFEALQGHRAAGYERKGLRRDHEDLHGVEAVEGRWKFP